MTIRSGVRFIATLSSALVALVALGERESNAFDYHEHRAMSARGLMAALKTPGAASAELKKDLLALHALTAQEASSRVCKDPDVFTLAAADVDGAVLGYSCFDAADVPSLAGDHASGPLRLIQRWLLLDVQQNGNSVTNYLRGAHEASGVGSPPTNCDDPTRSKEHVDYFIDAVRRPGGPTQADLLDDDGAYLCLASHNAHHFRAPRTSPLAAAEQQIPSVSSAYAFFHLRALAYARAATGVPEPRGIWLRAAAAALELYSLHFIEDMVASGHVAASRLELNPGSSLLTHNMHNDDGIAVTGSSDLGGEILTVRPELAGKLGPPGDVAYRTFGDGALSCFLNCKACSGNTDDAARKLDIEIAYYVGVALVAISLQEFGEAAAANAPTVTQQCEAELASCLPSQATNGPLGWLGAAADCEHTRTIQATSLAAPMCGTLGLAHDAASAGLLRALALAPIPVESPRPLYGSAVGFVARYSAGADALVSPTRDVWSLSAEARASAYEFLPPLDLKAERSITQLYGDLGIHVRGESCVDHCSRAHAERLGGLDVGAGISTAHHVFGLAGASDAALIAPRTTRSFRIAPSFGFDYGRRLDTHDPFASLFVGSIRTGWVQQEGYWFVTVGVGGAIEHVTAPAVPFSHTFDRAMNDGNVHFREHRANVVPYLEWMY